jgi:hypothetical protein
MLEIGIASVPVRILPSTPPLGEQKKIFEFREIERVPPTRLALPNRNFFSPAPRSREALLSRGAGRMMALAVGTQIELGESQVRSLADAVAMIDLGCWLHASWLAADGIPVEKSAPEFSPCGIVVMMLDSVCAC